MKPSLSHSIERLESRIAPSSLIIGTPPQSATYTDIDGDIVTVKVSTGDLSAMGVFTFMSVGARDQLQKLDLSSASFGHEDVAFSVAKKAGGDGLVSVGHIDSTGKDIGKLSIKGNLDQLDVGDAITSDGAMKSLTATSLGKYALSGTAFLFTGGLGSLSVATDVRDIEIFVLGGAVDGKLGSVTIGGSLLGGAGDFSGSILAQGPIGPVKIGKDAIAGSGAQSAFIRSVGGGIASVSIGGSLIGGNGNSTGTIEAQSVLGPVVIKGSVIGHDGLGSGVITSDSSSITSVTIGGSLIGGNGTSATGEIRAAALLGPVKIGGDVIGGAGGGGGFFSGFITGGSGITSLTIGGSLIGGSGPGSGSVFANFDFGKTKIGKDIRGGTGPNSGRLQSGGDLLDTTIGGSVIGGSANGSGQILAAGNLPVLAIKGSLLGGSLIADDLTIASLDKTGYVEAQHIGKVTIGGSIISGTDKALLGTLTKSGSIRAVDDIGSITVKGSLIGNTGVKGDSPVIISARGQAVATSTDIAIGSLTVGGTVSHALILGGFDVNLTAVNGGAQIGKVAVGGDWIASSLSAGVQNLGADNMVGGTGVNADNVNFGDLHDLHIAMGSAITASIAAIQIKGLAIGTGIGMDHFGFVAQEVKAFKASGITAAILAGANSDLIELSPPTGDLSIREAM